MPTPGENKFYRTAKFNGSRFNTNIRQYSTIRTTTTSGTNLLDPWFITGLADGDGSLYITIRKDPSYVLGFSVSPEFKIVAGVNTPNLLLLEAVQMFFGGIGSITSHNSTYSYTVRNKKDLRIIHNHFINYPLQTTKDVHFKLWAQILKMIENKEHIVKSGLLEILAVKSVFPNGLSESLKIAFPEVKAIEKPEFVASSDPLNGHWVAGFTQADGSFGLSYYKAPKMALGFTGQASLRVTQHERDLLVLNRISDLLGCGSVRNTNTYRKEWTFSVTKGLSSITSFFKDYPVYGAKQLDFQDFNKGVLILKNKEHLTAGGLKKLKMLVDNMNYNRVF